MKLTRPSDDPLTDVAALPKRSGVAKPPLAMSSTLTEPYQHDTYTNEVA
jgi:hypothetical protein